MWESIHQLVTSKCSQGPHFKRWGTWQDDVRTVLENLGDEIEIPVYDVPAIL